MVKRALCVGCNYPSKAFGLAGAVNDAFLIADTLQKNCGFEPENVCVLHDVYPGQKKSMKVDPNKKPTRVNILQRLQWLVRNARAGDVLFFSFSGYGLQVDDMDGYQDEGYDEAILPTDFVDGRDGDYTVIVTDDIHDVLMGLPKNCTVTVLMDCDHATSVIDVSGTLDGDLVNGLKYHNFCGLKAHTTKVQLAQHNRDVWQEERARAVKARPRFQPMMEVDNPRRGRLPTRPAMSRSTPVAFCYSAAAHGQTAMELQMSRSSVIDGKEATRQHGVLSWCFVQAMEELRFDCTHTELLWAVRRHMEILKAQDLPRMDQEVLLTFSTPLSNPQTMKVMQSLGALPGRPGSVFGSGASGHSQGAGQKPISIVPPPPPGFVASQGAAGASTGGTDGATGMAGAEPYGAVSQEQRGRDHMMGPGEQRSRDRMICSLDHLMGQGEQRSRDQMMGPGEQRGRDHMMGPGGYDHTMAPDGRNSRPARAQAPPSPGPESPERSLPPPPPPVSAMEGLNTGPAPHMNRDASTHSTGSLHGHGRDPWPQPQGSVWAPGVPPETADWRHHVGLDGSMERGSLGNSYLEHALPSQPLNSSLKPPGTSGSYGPPVHGVASAPHPGEGPGPGGYFPLGMPNAMMGQQNNWPPMRGLTPPNLFAPAGRTQSHMSAMSFNQTQAGVMPGGMQGQMQGQMSAGMVSGPAASRGFSFTAGQPGPRR